MLDEQAWTEYINQDDPTIATALRVFEKNEAFPKKPGTKANTQTKKRKK